MLKKLLFTTALLSTTLAAQAYAETDAQRLNRLEQEISILKRKQEVKQEEDAAASAKVPNFELGKKGFKVSNKDGSASLTIRGYAQVDNRTFIDDSDHSDVDTFLLRRMRPIIESEAGSFYFRLMPDFGGSSTQIFDAYAEYRAHPLVNFRIGKYKPPVSLDRLKSATDLTFTERSLPTNLAPNRDLGVSVFGNIIPQLAYEVGVFNGVEDLGNGTTDNDDSKDVAARLFAEPFKLGDSPLRGFGFGVGGSFGERSGSTTNRQVGDYRTPGQARFFAYRASTFGNGEQWRIAPQGYYYYGPLGVMGEYTVSSQELQNGAALGEAENDAWEVQLSYVLTGEDATYKGVTPDSPFNPSQGTWGAWEIAARTGGLKVDDDAFAVFADPAVSANEAKSFGVGINGYLNNNVKVTLDYENTEFEGGAAAGADREREQVVITRVQYKF